MLNHWRRRKRVLMGVKFPAHLIEKSPIGLNETHQRKTQKEGIYIFFSKTIEKKGHFLLKSSGLTNSFGGIYEPISQPTPPTRFFFFSRPISSPHTLLDSIFQLGLIWTSKMTRGEVLLTLFFRLQVLYLGFAGSPIIKYQYPKDEISKISKVLIFFLLAN